MPYPPRSRRTLLTAILYTFLLFLKASGAPSDFYGRNLSTNTNETGSSPPGYVQMAYFADWSIYPGPYKSNFSCADIDPTNLTHIIYSFANVSALNGSISLVDPWGDEHETQKPFGNDSTSSQGNDLYGCLQQVYLLKLKHRNLKVLLSVGGANYASSFKFLSSQTSREQFVQSAVQFTKDYGLDGLDIDMEFPDTTEQGQNLADLFTSLRTAFDQLSPGQNTTSYQLSAAVSAGVENSAYLVVDQMDAALDFWNIMAYDYSGSWTTQADNQANLYNVTGSSSNASTDAAVERFISEGATPSKLVIGVPLFGQAFEKTAGIGQPYSGNGPNDGSIQYNQLPKPGAQVFENNGTVSSYSYDKSTQELISYDTPHIVELKAKYIAEKGLGGAMYWELSGDKSGPDSLIATVAGVFNHSLDQTMNHISYPESQWDNIRNNGPT